MPVSSPRSSPDIHKSCEFLFQFCSHWLKVKSTHLGRAKQERGQAEWRSHWDYSYSSLWRLAVSRRLPCRTCPRARDFFCPASQCHPMSKCYAVLKVNWNINACVIVQAMLGEWARVSVKSVSVCVRVFKSSVRMCEGRACVCACVHVCIILRVFPNVTLSLYTDVLWVIYESNI